LAIDSAEAILLSLFLGKKKKRRGGHLFPLPAKKKKRKKRKRLMQPEKKTVSGGEKKKISCFVEERGKGSTRLSSSPRAASPGDQGTSPPLSIRGGKGFYSTPTGRKKKSEVLPFDCREGKEGTKKGLFTTSPKKPSQEKGWPLHW